MLDVAKGLQSEGFEYGQIGHHRYGIDLCLIDGGNTKVEAIEGMKVEVVTEVLTREWHFIEFATLDK